MEETDTSVEQEETAGNTESNPILETGGKNSGSLEKEESLVLYPTIRQVAWKTRKASKVGNSTTGSEGLRMKQWHSTTKTKYKRTGQIECKNGDQEKSSSSATNCDPDPQIRRSLYGFQGNVGRRHNNKGRILEKCAHHPWVIACRNPDFHTPLFFIINGAPRPVRRCAAFRRSKGGGDPNWLHKVHRASVETIELAQKKSALRPPTTRSTRVNRNSSPPARAGPK